MSNLQQFTVAGKVYAARSMAQAIYAHRIAMAPVKVAAKPRAMTPLEEARARRTQYHA